MSKKYVGKSNDGQSLGDRCKEYEQSTEQRLIAEDYIVIRLDGHKFSKFTKGLNRPVDTAFQSTMVEVTTALCKEFQCIVGYTQSDEITLVLPPQVVKGNNHQMYGGRVQKLVSLTAGFASATFNKLFTHPINKDKLGWFDARTYSVSTKEEAFNHIMWRGRDFVKNSKNMFAQTYCSHKSLLNLNSQEQINFCLSETGNDWSLQNDQSKYGTIIKKVLYDKTTEEYGTVQRSKYISLGIQLSTYSQELVDRLFSKYYEKG